MTLSPSNDRWLTGNAYEVYMGRWSRRLARVFLDWLKPEAGGHYLEVGCGTGALTSALCELAQPASVLACDPSNPFIEHAREKLPDERVSFVVAGTDTLPTRAGGFDHVLSGLVLNFVPEPAQALAAIRERLRSGGTVAAYVWDYSDGMEFLRQFWDEATALDPRAEVLDEGKRFPLCSASALGSLFQAAGFERVETHALEITTEFQDFEDYWTPFLRGTGPAPSYVASLELASREALKARLARRLSVASKRAIVLSAKAWAVRGQR